MAGQDHHDELDSVLASAERSGEPAGNSSKRAASVMLRQTDGSDDAASMMDPATKSLADAVKITYRLLQLALVALVVLYFFSGVESVREFETGVRVVFGKIQQDDLGPGPHFSYPRPVGEFVRIRSSEPAMKIRGVFWPFLDGEAMERSEREGLRFMAGRNPRLDPARDGAVVTGDGNLAHMQWQVTYRRDNAQNFVTNILPAHEKRIVQAAIQRGVVHAAAGASIDELLKDVPDASRAPGTFRTMDEAAQIIAQRTLDQMESGIEIETLEVINRSPPVFVITAFDEVENARQKANTQIDNARKERNQALTEVAGDAAGALLALIDRYETELEASHDEDAARVLSLIDNMLSGETIEYAGQTVPGVLSGMVKDEIIFSAERKRSGAVNHAIGDLASYSAKREAYRVNPELLLAREWRESMSQMMANETIVSQFLPAGIRTVVSLNRDPKIQRDIIKRIQQQEVEDAQRQRMISMARERAAGTTSTTVGNLRNARPGAGSHDSHDH